ncbi:MAG: hypothetical protein HKN46_02720 [Acidimicrobiia bacterium]|nr:hypothetical protein [Acidimicrobiia bacterium]
MASRSTTPKWIVPVAVGVIVGLLWVTGSVILSSREPDGPRPSRIALSRTQGGEALRVVVEGCDSLVVRRVSVLLGSEPVWEVRGVAPPSRTAFVVGETADPLVVTAALDGPLEPDVRYTVEVESDRVEAAAFTPREVPPVGVLHDGLERTEGGFIRLVDEAWCRSATELPLVGSLFAQFVIVVAGAAFAVVAAGMLEKD